MGSALSARWNNGTLGFIPEGATRSSLKEIAGFHHLPDTVHAVHACMHRAQYSLAGAYCGWAESEPIQALSRRTRSPTTKPVNTPTLSASMSYISQVRPGE